MEPLSDEQKRRLLAERPGVTEEEIAEYERLLAEYFSNDPEESRRQSGKGGEPDLLTQLHQKLFGN